MFFANTFNLIDNRARKRVAINNLSTFVIVSSANHFSLFRKTR